jgi:hypothetical protein
MSHSWQLPARQSCWPLLRTSRDAQVCVWVDLSEHTFSLRTPARTEAPQEYDDVRLHVTILVNYWRLRCQPRWAPLCARALTYHAHAVPGKAPAGDGGTRCRHIPKPPQGHVAASTQSHEHPPCVLLHRRTVSQRISAYCSTAHTGAHYGMRVSTRLGFGVRLRVRRRPPDGGSSHNA